MYFLKTYQNDTAAIYCSKYHEKLDQYVKKNYKTYLSLYDDIGSEILYRLPRFHYTEINNSGYTIYIDDLAMFNRLKDKNNTIVYYINNAPNHNMNYTKLYNLMQGVDGVLIEDSKIEEELIRIVFKYTKELQYV